MSRKQIQTGNYLHTPTPSTQPLKLSSLSDHNTSGTYNVYMGKKCKEADRFVSWLLLPEYPFDGLPECPAGKIVK